MASAAHGRRRGAVVSWEAEYRAVDCDRPGGRVPRCGSGRSPPRPARRVATLRCGRHVRIIEFRVPDSRVRRSAGGGAVVVSVGHQRHDGRHRLHGGDDGRHRLDWRDVGRHNGRHRLDWRVVVNRLHGGDDGRVSSPGLARCRHVVGRHRLHGVMTGVTAWTGALSVGIASMVVMTGLARHRHRFHGGDDGRQRRGAPRVVVPALAIEEAHSSQP